MSAFDFTNMKKLILIIEFNVYHRISSTLTNQGTGMDLKRSKCFVAPAVPYQAPLLVVHFCTFLSVPLKEHFCTPSDRNVLYVQVKECTHLKGRKLVPNEVQLELHAILYLYEAKTYP